MLHETSADFLPSDSIDILSPRAVAKLLGLSVVTIWRMREAKPLRSGQARQKFPEPIQLSPGRIGWRRADIERWLEQRAMASAT